MDNTTPSDLIGRMFKAGAHFGFSKSRRHPSVAPFLFGTKQGFDIFDLEKTSELLLAATAFMHEAGENGKQVLLVGTKEEIGSLVRAEAARAEVHFAVNRWVGGTLTNFTEIKKRIAYLTTLRSERESGELDRKYTKKERLMLTRDIERLEQSFEGILTMEKIPDILLAVDPRHEAIAVDEAHHAHIPVVAVTSSDCNIGNIEKPVVVNDAHRASVALALSELLSAYLEGKKEGSAKAASKAAEKKPE